MSILHLLSNSNFIVVNRTVISSVGLDAAIMLGELASEYFYWEQHNGLENGHLVFAFLCTALQFLSNPNSDNRRNDH